MRLSVIVFLKYINDFKLIFKEDKRPAHLAFYKLLYSHKVL